MLRERLLRLFAVGVISALCWATATAHAASPMTFQPVVPGVTLAFPQDRGAHPGFRTEWWYATGWLQQPDGKPLGFQITFFRSATEHDRADPSAFAPTQLIIAHAAISDPELGHLVHDQRIARQGFDLAYAKSGNTEVKLNNWSMTREIDGRYEVQVMSGALNMHLTLTPTQPILLQGENGYSQKGPNTAEASYYYSEPQLRVSGYVGGYAPQRAHVPVTGSAWLDHEWSSTVLNPEAVGWDWLGANMNDGSALMAFSIRDKHGHALWAHATWRQADGAVRNFPHDKVVFTPLRQWRSPRTDIAYPVSQRLNTDTIQWQLDPLFDDQELDSSQSTGAVYWEGAVRISRNGERVGQGYLELTGYGKPMDLK